MDEPRPRSRKLSLGTDGDSGGSLREVIESHSRRVDLKQLAEKNQSGRVLTFSALEKIMTEAIANLLLKGPADPLLDRALLQEQTREELRRLLESHQQALRDKSEALRARETLEQQVAQLRGEIDRARLRLRDEKERGLDPVDFAPESVARMRAQVGEWIKGTLADLKLKEPGAAPEIEERMLGAFELCLGNERKQLTAERSAAHAREVEQLERRIDKLNKALVETEQALHQTLAGADIDPGLKSVYSAVQGLAPDSPNACRKKDLIRVVFVNNLTLRRLEVRPEDVAGIPEGLLLKAPEPEPGTASAQFPPPVDPVTDETAY